MAAVTWRTVNAYDDGSIDYVSKMEAATGDAIVWLINNTSSRVTIRVKMKDFHKKSGGANLAVVDLFHQGIVKVPPGDTGVIAGQVTYLPPSRTTVTMKYTISVKVGTKWFDHDPDLDVNRPGH